ncbi:MAG: exonuclease domain-containing protein [Chloroflexi bacterium]|nr:exonuclease domain-containing protein [Chloroflexota bacterium]MCL5076246.1 exonuclease domain-containing protein [Chloroflexota bacterium]
MMNQIYVSLDLEMTSPRAEEQEIIEIAAIKFRGDTVIDTWSTLVNPGRSIPFNIQILTGIKQADVDRAPKLPQVAGPLVKLVKDHPIVAHSVSSDLNCLQRKGITLTNPQIDTFELANILIPQLTNRSLAALAEHFHLEHTLQHRAAADALVTKELFVALTNLALELDISVIQEINHLTAKSSWPLRCFFLEIEKEKSRLAYNGTSIRQRLAAKEEGDNAILELLLLGEKYETLTPSERKKQLGESKLVEIFEPDGLLSKTLSSYEYRPQQIEMTKSIIKVFNEGGQLIVEAGTGTGKSMSYLMPAIYFAVENSEHIVISTNTINLQDQLYTKDIPQLKQILPLNFKTALLKGRSNYLCRRRFATLRHHPGLTEDEIATLVKILVWLQWTLTGDLAELNLTDTQKPVWAKIWSPAELCLGTRCPYNAKGTCFLYHARHQAEAAHLIIVNHALLLSDMVANSQILPDYRHLIIDEAHHFEDVATDQLGFNTTERDIYSYLDDLSQVLTPERRGGLLAEIKSCFHNSTVPATVQGDVEVLIQEIYGCINRARESTQRFYSTLNSFLRQHAQESRGYDTRLRLTRNTRSQPNWGGVEIAWDNLHLQLAEIQDKLAKIALTLEQMKGQAIAEYDESITEISASLLLNQTLQAQINAVVSNPSDNQIYWITGSGSNGEITLNAVPLRVGEILAKQLFATKETVILTSATLSIAGRFDYIKERLGLPYADELLLDSPFDYERSTLIYIPDDIPEPEKPHYQHHLQQAIMAICRATEGRALILFTSRAQLQQTHQSIRQPLERENILVLGHGLDGSSRQLLQTFKTNPRTILLGTNSFWEGIDVVGEALSVLIITRLPFAVPTDPVFAARSEMYEEPFNQYSVPQTILRFKQGFGRLIRSRTDRGIFIVLDRRLQTRPYGQFFLRSLPHCTLRYGPISNLPAAAADWLRRVVD